MQRPLEEAPISKRYIHTGVRTFKEFERRPVSRVVITGYESITPLGYADETFKSMLLGKSGVIDLTSESTPSRNLHPHNHAVMIGAPLIENYDFFQALNGQSELKQKKYLPLITGMGLDVVRRASKMADLVGEDGLIRPTVDRDRVAGWISSGIGSAHHVTEVQRKLDDAESPEIGSARISAGDSLKIFPEELNARIAMMVGYSGWPGNSAEACATGAANIIEGVRLIQDGLADVVIAGGFEDILHAKPELSIGVFANLALSKRNNDPEGASRPFNKDRDGFVLGAGGGVVILESLEHANERTRRGENIQILAEVDGIAKSMDGKNATDPDPKRVAKTIEQALYENDSRRLKRPDVVYAHATSTQVGDQKEAEVINQVLSEEARLVPVTAIKSMLGHMLGGAGAENIIAAIQTLRTGLVPAIRNLDVIDPNLPKLLFVRGKPMEVTADRILTLSYGFGGHNSVLLLKRFVE